MTGANVAHFKRQLTTCKCWGVNSSELDGTQARTGFAECLVATYQVPLS